MNPLQTIVITLCAAVAIGGIVFAIRAHRQLPSALFDRPELTIAQIREQFYPDLGVTLDQFAAWWTDIASAFEVPAGRIRPGDKFGGELPFREFLGITDEDIALYGALKKRVGTRAARRAIPDIHTVDEFIRFLASQLKPHSSS